MTAVADYTLSFTSSSASAVAGSQGTYNGTLTSINSYSSAVNLSCGSGMPPTCTVSPASVTPTLAGAPFSVTASSPGVQTYNFTFSAVGTDSQAKTHTSALSYNSTFDFAIANNSGTQTVSPGSTASFTLGLTPAGTGNTFPNNATITCTNLPSRSSCLPLQVNAGSGAATPTLMISTTAPTAAMQRRSGGVFYALWLPIPMIIVFGNLGKKQRKRLLATLLLGVSFLMLGAMLGCGGGSNGGGGGQPGTPAGTYTVNVTATSGTLAHSTSVTLTVQ